MSVAFNDVVILRNLFATEIKNLKNREATANIFKTQYCTLRRPVATTVNILAVALHSVFAANDDPVLPEMRKGCWEYFKLGGECVNGPLSLLSVYVMTMYYNNDL
jgi:squalene monooxygenase